MTLRTYSQERYWKKLGSACWEPARYITEAGMVINPKYTPEYQRAATDTVSVLARFVRRLPGV